MLRRGEQANRLIATVSPVSELSRVLVCFDHVASIIVTLRRVALSALLTATNRPFPLIRHCRTCSSVDF